MTDDQCIMISSNQRHKDTKKELLLQVFYSLFLNSTPTGNKKSSGHTLHNQRKRLLPWQNVTEGPDPSATF